MTSLNDTVSPRSAPLKGRLEVFTLKDIARGDAVVSGWCKSRTKPGPLPEPVVIHPFMAAAILTHRNPDNRNVKWSRVKELASDMNQGLFVHNGETIIFSKEGLLNDGQNRLWACVESGVPITSVVCVGYPRNTRATLDTGSARTLADFLSMTGFKDTKELGLAVRLILMYEKDRNVSRATSARPTNAALVSFAQERPDAVLALQRASVIAVEGAKARDGKPVISRGMLGWLFHTLTRIAPEEDVEEFILRLLDGANLDPKSPIMVARDRILTERKFWSDGKAVYLVKAWNAYRLNKPLPRGIDITDNIVPVVAG